MANQIEREPSAEQIDDFLTYVAQVWATVPADAAEWEEWDEESQLVYRYEWTIPRDRRADLQQWAAEGHLTPEQQCRFEQIERLVEANGAILDRLLDWESDRNAPKPSPVK